jgi:hypothetical protein
VSNTILSSFDISEVTDVSGGVLGASVSVSIRVVVGSSSDASVGQISKLMDVESVETGGHALHFGGDLDLLSLSLDKLNDTLDGRVSLNAAHGVVSLLHYVMIYKICNYIGRNYADHSI